MGYYANVDSRNGESDFYYGFKKSWNQEQIKEEFKLEEIIGDGEFEIPKEFDLRNVLNKCASTSFIRDQSTCGSCYAVATESVISDNYCKHT